MKVIGITGGVGAGKSQVLTFLKEEYGAFVCQADEVARTLQRRGNICYEKIIGRYGEEILNPEGELNRDRLASVIFADSGERQWLNETVHPLVKQSIQRQMEEERGKGTSLFVLEAALLLEDHYDKICDELWFIYAERSVRKRRLMESRNYAEAKIEAVFAAQLSDDAFRSRCDRVVDNSGTFEKTCRQIRDILDETM